METGTKSWDEDWDWLDKEIGIEIRSQGTEKRGLRHGQVKRDGEGVNLGGEWAKVSLTTRRATLQCLE